MQQISIDVHPVEGFLEDDIRGAAHIDQYFADGPPLDVCFDDEGVYMRIADEIDIIL